ncbi:MAG TPA: MbtH family NRPS accessory protein [Stellaceae bacterium]
MPRNTLNNGVSTIDNSTAERQGEELRADTQLHNAPALWAKRWLDIPAGLEKTDAHKHAKIEAPRGGVRPRQAGRKRKCEAAVSDTETEVEPQYDVVVNDEEQYSIWPAGKAIPNGWRSVGSRGDKSSCLAYIKEVWTDMRPLSLRRKMEAGGA